VLLLPTFYSHLPFTPAIHTFHRVKAIVLRNYPVGKGFMVSDTEAGGRGERRPPYTFIKTWSLSHESKSGMVRVKYDIRDTGRRLSDADVLFNPQV